MEKREKSGFYTPKGYRMHSEQSVTESMEDYIEMICRIAARDGFARINDLSRMLNVNPSSASKMSSKLESLGLVSFPRYGVIQLTPKGKELGEYLVRRHKTIEDFLRLLNGTADETLQAEQIEHYINEYTVKNLERLTELLKNTGWGCEKTDC